MGLLKLESYKYAKLLSPRAKGAKILSVDKVQKFLVSSYEELKKVTWPSKKDTIRLTGYVIGVSFGVGLFVMLLDFVFAKLLTFLLAN
ncbi:TPA: preprotein translocase subunit SecE [candidate division WWE3 bacterium]|uniref:Protein translocase subunit SecE n=1 Tax=candidate division WWE3 bacterium TaxID=2053526 RepID=A0A3D0ZQR4_UNCKA|nr:preprotein translocase subunit SecE [candidate division WWE3 bacterium]HCC42621.1 preprotein translocase subunit SecE [candidate division WWE3 bacterium]